MIEQISNSIKFVAFFTASKIGKTGLTVTVDVYNPAGALVVTAGSATAIGGGAYQYVLSSGSVTAEGEYVAVFKTSDGTVDVQHIPSLWVVGRGGIEELDATISSRLATAGYTAPPALMAIISGILDAAITGHLSAGSVGLAINGATAPTTAQIWAYVLSNALSAGSTLVNAGGHSDIPAPAGTCNVDMYVIGANGAPLAGVVGTLTTVSLPGEVDTGQWIESGTVTATSGVDGRMLWAAIPQGVMVELNVLEIGRVRERIRVPHVGTLRV